MSKAKSRQGRTKPRKATTGKMQIKSAIPCLWKIAGKWFLKPEVLEQFRSLTLIETAYMHTLCLTVEANLNGTQRLSANGTPYQIVFEPFGMGTYSQGKLHQALKANANPNDVGCSEAYEEFRRDPEIMAKTRDSLEAKGLIWVAKNESKRYVKKTSVTVTGYEVQTIPQYEAYAGKGASTAGSRQSAFRGQFV